MVNAVAEVVVVLEVTVKEVTDVVMLVVRARKVVLQVNSNLASVVDLDVVVVLLLLLLREVLHQDFAESAGCPIDELLSSNLHATYLN